MALMLLEGVRKDPSPIIKPSGDPSWRKKKLLLSPGPNAVRSLGHWHGADSGRTQGIVKVRRIKVTARLTLQILEGLAA